METKDVEKPYRSPPVHVGSKRSKPFTTDELCRIIERCATVGVAQLKLDDIELSFRDNFLYTPQQSFLDGPAANVDLPESVNTPPASPVSEHNFRNNHRMSMVDPDLLDDMRRTQLMIDDPAAYEQEMIRAHMRQDPDEAAQNR